MSCASCRFSSGSNLAICLNHRPLFDEQKIDVEDVRHNDNYNIYCTDEIAARKFLSPSVLAWFDEQISIRDFVPISRGISSISVNIPMNICLRCRTPRRSWMRGRWKKRLSI